MVFRKVLSLGLTLIVIMYGAAAYAGVKKLSEIMDQSVSYSATRIVKTKDGSMTMQEYHAPGKQRLEMNDRGQNIVIIKKDQSNKNWMLLPEKNVYMEISTEQFNQKAAGDLQIIKSRKMGKETVAGLSATKYKGVFKTSRGERGNGYYWLADEYNLPVKLDMTLGRSGNKFKMQVSNLKIASQKSTLFDVPQSYKPMSGAIPGMKEISSHQMTGQQIMANMMQARAKGEEEKVQREKQKKALSKLTADYLEGCWWAGGEGGDAPYKFHKNGSFEVGTPAGNDYAMQKSDDDYVGFRNRYHGLVSQAKDEFVVRTSRRGDGAIAFKRGSCPAGTHAVAGSDNDDKSIGESVDKAKDLMKAIGGFF